MKRNKIVVVLTALCLGAGTLWAADPNGKAADNKIYAQTLVNALIKERSDLLIIGLHGVAPGAKDSAIIACNLDHIGNLDSADDLAAGIEHKTLLEPKSPEKFEIVMPLKDAAGAYIGAVVMIFKYRPADTELGMYQKALTIRDELAKQIPDFAALFASSK